MPETTSENATVKKGKTLFDKQIAGFFIRLFILFSAWFVCYNLILKPSRIIDRPLTNFLTGSVVKIINTFPSKTVTTWHQDPERNCSYMVQNNRVIFDVFDVCNGIDLMFIYVGIIMLLPYQLKRKIIFSIGGVLAIILFNIIRITSLYYIYIYQNAAFDFSHHYLFTLLMYMLIVCGWLIFIKKGRKNEEQSR
jgi:exosortase/archaeosortase family protein